MKGVQLAAKAFIVLLCGRLALTVQPSLQPACDVHVKNPGKPPANTVLPQKAQKEWLYGSLDEIERWYAEGKKGCIAHLAAAVEELKIGHADYFTDPNHMPAKTDCRGRNALFDYTGTVLVPFGPYSECPTYSKCWFGLLSCGAPKDAAIKESLLATFVKEMKDNHIPGTLPEYTKWSVRALHMLIRVVGAEIVVPDVRYATLSDGEDVLIGQYVLTRPASNAQLEMRMFELYPSQLLAWSPHQIEEYGMQNIRSMHLGGSEGRCRPWTQCKFENNCCGCDERSFVAGTPAAVSVPDGSARCPGVRDRPLPLCPVRDSSQRGRWIASARPEFQPHCRADAVRSVVFHQDATHMPRNAHLADQILRDVGAFNLSAHRYHGEQWFEASGDPCLINSRAPEEDQQTHWFYAPYTCKYHFYSGMELHKCLLDKNLSHIHIAGDSMSRDLFTFISLYLGVPAIAEADLKHLTNTLKQSNIQFHSGKVMISEGYSWDYNEGVMRLIEEAPLPSIYISNYALAHRNWNYPLFQQKWNETEYQYWSKQRPARGVPLPRYMFFQNAKELSGRRNIGWSGNVFRQDSAYLERNYTGFGFSVLDEFLFSAGRYDYHIPTSDGWHFGGTKRQMEVVALFNMVCNDWLAEISSG